MEAHWHDRNTAEVDKCTETFPAQNGGKSFGTVSQNINNQEERVMTAALRATNSRRFWGSEFDWKHDDTVIFPSEGNDDSDNDGSQDGNEQDAHDGPENLEHVESRAEEQMHQQDMDMQRHCELLEEKDEHDNIYTCLYIHVYIHIYIYVYIYVYIISKYKIPL
jgi:hypothetical protein